ncbi:MAG: S1/P1 nuclease [Gammaproteobacteria bacterium]|nr:S1/P1 nuclease [Gammaproteobacteria bacterium]
MLKIVKLLATTVVLFIAITFVYSSSVLAFGAKGHRIVGHIAENHLTPEAQARIKKITKGHYLAELSTWPDKARSDPRWKKASPWHYISIDDDETFDAFERNPKGDVLKELESLEKELKDPTVKGEKKWQALAFYIHFMGDIHQPLHVGRRDDRGGNNITVEWFGEKMKLHALWDSGLIEQENLGFREYASFLDNASEKQIKKWQAASYLDYAKESKAMRAKIYDFGKQRTSLPSLGYQYSFENIDDLNQRLLQAGLRLAGKLNEIFAP